MTVGSMFILTGALGGAFGRQNMKFMRDETPLLTYLDDTQGPTVGSPRRVDPDPLNNIDSFDDARRTEPSSQMASVQTGKSTVVTAWRGQTDEPTIGNMGMFLPAGDNAQYWALSKAQASTYSDDVIEAEIKLNNPVVINNDNDFLDLIKRATGEELTPSQMMAFFLMGRGSESSISLEQIAKMAGHDAVIIRLWTKANDDTMAASLKANKANENVDSVIPGSVPLMEDGQNLRAMFDQNEIIIFDKNRFRADDTTGSTVGAAQRVDPAGDVKRETLRPTGTRIEDLPLNPALRLFNSGNAQASRVAADLTDTSGMMLGKVDEGIPMVSDSVTTNFKTTYLNPLLEAINEADDAFLKFRGMTPNSAGIMSNSFNLMKERALRINDRNALRLKFNQRVGLALMRGEDTITDSMTSFVNEAAASYKKLLDFVGEEAMGVQLFVKEIDKYIERLRKSSQNAGRVEKLVAKREAIIRGGIQATRTSEGYFPRVYDVEYLLTTEGQAAWMKTLTPHIGEAGARDAWNKITNSFDDTFDAFDGLMDQIANSGAQARMLDVSDEILVPFLDFNVESVVRDHVRRMGMDIELTRRFGSVGMEDVIAAIPKKYREDVTSLRDIIRGTYGRPSDPHSHLNRGIRILKNFSPLVYMGGAAISSLPDIARPLMTEGINALYGGGLKAFLSSQRDLIIKMNRKTVREVGEALDMTLSMRAFALADIGSSFGRQSHLEKTIKSFQAPYFFLNGLNVWNTMMKEFTGLVVTQRMMNAIYKPWEKISKSDRERLLTNGIDEPMALRIRDMMETPGFGHNIDGYWFPELGRWTDVEAASAFKRALNQQINRTIVTPEVADRALWTQTNVGSMVAQFKSFGQASTQRVLISGLQERNANFWHGAIAMTSLGLVVNEIKDIQYGSKKEKTWGQTLSSAIDRAGLLAVFSDFNHALEVISSNRVGLDALSGGTEYPSSPRRMVSTFGGPSGGVLFDIGNMATETLQGEAFQRDFYRSMKRLTPYQSHPLFNPTVGQFYPTQ